MGSIKMLNTIKRTSDIRKLFATVFPVIFCPIPNLAQSNLLPRNIRKATPRPKKRQSFDQ